jgi:queuine tRNA-ribosyltransferase subunit QTRTD1
MDISSTEQSSDMAENITFDISGDVAATTSARVGTLNIPGRKALGTPNFFAISSRGVVPHLTPDVILTHTQFGGIHMALEDCKSLI